MKTCTIGKTRHMLASLIYGVPPAISSNGGATWKTMNPAAAHSDWCLIDWTDPEHRFVLAFKHERHGLVVMSRDGGQTFTELGKGYGCGWIFDNQTAVLSVLVNDGKPRGLVRTTDGGKTWAGCGDY